MPSSPFGSLCALDGTSQLSITHTQTLVSKHIRGWLTVAVVVAQAVVEPLQLERGVALVNRSNKHSTVNDVEE